MKYICFTDEYGNPAAIPESQAGIRLDSRLGVCVFLTACDSGWVSVKGIQVIDCAQNALAWMGLGVDTEGRLHSGRELNE